MKSILNNIFGVSKRGKGKVVDGKVTEYELITYDYVGKPIDFDSINETHKQLMILLKKQQLREDRINKLNKLNNG